MENIIIEVVLSAILLLFPLWRIFKRAGLSPTLSLTVLITYLGLFVGGLILALAPWKRRNQAEGV